VTALFRIALLVIAVVLSAPLRFASIADSQNVSEDDRFLTASGVVDQDDSMSEANPGEDIPDLTWRPEGVVPRDFGRAPLATELSFRESGLAPSLGVPDDLFRPPRV
jgi:hypothetical protein